MLFPYEFWLVNIMMRSSYAWCPGRTCLSWHFYFEMHNEADRFGFFLILGSINIAVEEVPNGVDLAVVEVSSSPLWDKYQPVMTAAVVLWTQSVQKNCRPREEQVKAVCTWMHISCVSQQWSSASFLCDSCHMCHGRAKPSLRQEALHGELVLVNCSCLEERSLRD